MSTNINSKYFNNGQQGNPQVYVIIKMSLSGKPNDFMPSKICVVMLNTILKRALPLYSNFLVTKNKHPLFNLLIKADVQSQLTC